MELDKLKEYKVYLTDEEKKALVGIQICCRTFEGSVLTAIVEQIFGCYEELEN
jgi:hypothetical protein